MDISLNVNTTYYLSLYALVFIVRFFKPSPYSDNKVIDWHEFFSYSSLEVIYTSAGFLVLLLGKEKKLLAFYFVVYTIMLYVAANIDRSDRAKEFGKTTSHIVIITIIAVLTVVSFSTVLYDPADIVRFSKEGPAPVVQKLEPRPYTVVLTYNDLSLAAHLGVANWGTKRLSFSTKVEAPTPGDAMKMAKERFWSDPASRPYRLRTGENRESQISIEEATSLVIAQP